jgi:hypothetical protein
MSRNPMSQCGASYVLVDRGIIHRIFVKIKKTVENQKPGREDQMGQTKNRRCQVLWEWM